MICVSLFLCLEAHFIVEKMLRFWRLKMEIFSVSVFEIVGEKYTKVYFVIKYCKMYTVIHLPTFFQKIIILLKVNIINNPTCNNPQSIPIYEPILKSTYLYLFMHIRILGCPVYSTRILVLVTQFIGSDVGKTVSLRLFANTQYIYL